MKRLFSSLVFSIILSPIMSTIALAGSHGVASECIKPDKGTKRALSTPKISMAKLKHSHEHEELSLRPQWSGAEHMQLGDAGFISACQKLKNPIEACKNNQIHRRDKKIPFTYGGVLALGDFYLRPDKAFLEKRRVRSIEKLFRCIDKEGRVHEEQKHNPEADYPDCTWVNVIHGGSYLKVVTKNYEHFAWDNMKAYVQKHERALAYAKASYRAKSEGKIDYANFYANKALFINAFADHYLTDSFAAGHLRVPRYEVKRWAKKNTSRFFGSFVGDALGMLLHDFEGKDENFNEIGLEVKNSNNTRWTTRSDKYLNVCSEGDEDHIKIPLLAVEASVAEILTAIETGETPSHSFAATWFVPFPDDEGLNRKWGRVLRKQNSRSAVTHMRNSLPKPLQWVLKKRYIERMIRDMHKITRNFRYRVKKEINSNEKLQQRLPDPYIRNFLELN